VNAVSKYKTYYGINYPVDYITKKTYGGGQASLTTTTHYTYNSNLQISSTKVTNSDGSVIEKHNKYPLDYTVSYSGSSDPAFAIYQMKQKHMFDIPIESITYKSSTQGALKYVTDAKLVEYKCQNVNGVDNIPLPQYFYDFQNAYPVPENGGSYPFVASSITSASGFLKDARYVKTKTIDKYDTKGKLTELHNEYEPTQTIIYSPVTDNPIATVSNANSGKVFYTGFEFENTSQTYFTTLTTSSDFQPFAGEYAGKTTGGSANTSGVAWYTQINTGTFNGSKGYKMSVRAKGASNGFLFACTTGGTTITKTLTNSGTSGSWNLLSVEFTANELINSGASGFYIGIGGGTNAIPAYFDELKVYPSDALMSTTSFDYMGNILATGDANDQYSFSTYDDLGNKLIVKDQKNDIVQVNETSFGNPAIFNVYDSNYDGVLKISQGIVVAANRHGDGSRFKLTVQNSGYTHEYENNTGIFSVSFPEPNEYTLTLEYSNDNTELCSYSKEIIVSNQ
jgi:hypothetical protein